MNKASVQDYQRLQAEAASALRLVAVVVSHNRLEHLKETLRCLLDAPAAQLAAVLVVDNASDDGTEDWLATQHDPRLQVLRSSVNLGGAGGFETGLRHAVAEMAPDWVVVMDDDARPAPGALSAFHAMNLEGWDAVAGAAYHPDGTICEMNRPTYNPFWHKRVFMRSLLGGGRDAFHLGTDDYAVTGLRRVDGASFVGLFLNVRVFERTGFPEGRLFLYGDDAIFTMRLTRSGHRIGFCPSLRFEHDSSTYTTQDPRIRPLWKVYYYHRNLLILYRLASGVFFLPVAALYIPRWIARVRHHGGERRLYLALLFRAIRDGLLRRTDLPHDALMALASRATEAAQESNRGSPSR
ncbi:MAG: glycosyltransferase [Pararhodobacter sp.]|nr:glycosyltransferase [Pararhodobacter sp.]